MLELPREVRRPAPPGEGQSKVNTPTLIHGSRPHAPTVGPFELHRGARVLAFTGRNRTYPAAGFKHIEQTLNARPLRNAFPQSKLPPRSPRSSEPWEPPGGAGSGRPSGSGGVTLVCTPPVRRSLTSLEAGRVASFGGFSPRSGPHSRVPRRGTGRVSGRAGGLLTWSVRGGFGHLAWYQ